MHMQHTPGPWHVIPSHSFASRKIGRSPAFDPLPIAEVGPTSRTAADFIGGEREMLANARLIAAAPELLAAARKAVAGADEDSPSWSGIAELSAAIAKATSKA